MIGNISSNSMVAQVTEKSSSNSNSLSSFVLEEYSSNPEYSQEVLKTSLSQILSDSNNYKSVSFYA